MPVTATFILLLSYEELSPLLLVGVLQAMVTVIYKKQNESFFSPQELPGAERGGELSTAAPSLLSLLSSFHICQRGGGRGTRLFPLTPLSSLPFQARHLPCLCPRTPWTRTDTKKPPRHGRPRCPLLSQKLARATEELPCSREARPLIHILRMAACSPITYTISQLH